MDLWCIVWFWSFVIKGCVVFLRFVCGFYLFFYLFIEIDFVFELKRRMLIDGICFCLYELILVILFGLVIIISFILLGIIVIFLLFDRYF